MPDDKLEKELGNVLVLTILVPVIQYLEVFINTSHNLSPDEFLKVIFVPEKSKSTKSSKAAQTRDGPDFCVANRPKIVPEKLQSIQIPPVSLQRPIAQLFFEIIRFRRFLSNVVHEFYTRRNRRSLPDISQTIAIIYVLIYRTSVSLIPDAMNCLTYFNGSKMLGLLSFLLTPELSSRFYITGCDIFDIDFVEKKILDPFIKALPILQIIYTNLVETRRPKPFTKKVTIPIEMNVLKHRKKYPAPPVCTPERSFAKTLTKPVPKTLYKMPEIETKMTIVRREHREQAAQRLEDANAKAPACSMRKNSKKYQRVLEEIKEMKIKNRLPIVAKKVPTFKSVPVKKTISTILREGAFIASSEFNEVEKLKELMKGSFDPSELQRLEDEMRQYEKEEILRKIEEKHLSGLISYEDSILAKQQLVKEATEQGDRVRLEREEINAKLEKYRDEEMEKLKRMVEKCHIAEQAAKNAHNFMVDVKREKAAEVAEESRRIKVHLLGKKKEELQKKLQVIHEIKTFQTLRNPRVKEFDPTKTSRLGLMCEMSLAELKEKLLFVRGKWHDELIARKEAVKERRQTRKDLVELTRKTIDAYRVSTSVQPSLPSASIVSDHSKILHTPELEALRRKLEERRIKRFQKMNPPNTNVIFKSKLLTESSAQCGSAIRNGIS